MKQFGSSSPHTITGAQQSFCIPLSELFCALCIYTQIYRARSRKRHRHLKCNLTVACASKLLTETLTCLDSSNSEQRKARQGKERRDVAEYGRHTEYGRQVVGDPGFYKGGCGSSNWHCRGGCTPAPNPCPTGAWSSQSPLCNTIYAATCWSPGCLLLTGPFLLTERFNGGIIWSPKHLHPCTQSHEVTLDLQ